MGYLYYIKLHNETKYNVAVNLKKIENVLNDIS